MRKKILILGIVLALVTAVAVPMAVLAVTGEAEQEASTTQAATIEIRNQAGDTAITSITFPPAAVSTTVKVPYNNLDTGTPQLFHDSASLPVATLVTDTAYIAWINIAAGTGWTDTVSAEDYYIVTAVDRTISESDFTSGKTTFSAWGTAVSTGVTLTATATNNNDLYLTVDLKANVGKSGTSTLTILGETP